MEVNEVAQTEDIRERSWDELKGQWEAIKWKHCERWGKKPKNYFGMEVVELGG